MLSETLKDKDLSTRLCLHRTKYTVILAGILCILLISCYCLLTKSINAQKNSILENTYNYATSIDKYITDADLHPLKDSIAFENGLTMSSSMSSAAAFAVLKDGKVLFIMGRNVLSLRLVSSITENAKSTSSIYVYKDLNLPDYYFYTISLNGLDYCYYEPVLKGWSLFRQAASASTGMSLFLIALLFTAILNISLWIATSPEKETENRVIEITAPDENAWKDPFGSYPYYSGIIIDYHNQNPRGIRQMDADESARLIARGNKNHEPAKPEILKLFDQIICENLSVNKISYRNCGQQHSGYLQYHLNFENYNLRVLSDSLKMNLYNAAPDYKINIYYGTAVHSREEMENELFYLHQHLHYSLIFGYNMRLSIEQIREYEASTSVLDANVASTIQNHLRTRAYDDLYNYINQCKNTVKYCRRSGNTKYSFSEIYRFTEEAFSAVKLFFQENSFEHTMVQTSCITILRSNPGFDNFCEYLISCVKSYQQENLHVLSSRNEQIMNSIYMYIEQDLAGANLNSIARKMQITDSHLSRVFKKNTGSNFSEYLSERKLEEAAKLLLQDNKLKVADISDMLGYGNPTYFLSRFKAKYGISPSAYRKEHIAAKARNLTKS